MAPPQRTPSDRALETSLLKLITYALQTMCYTWCDVDVLRIILGVQGNTTVLLVVPYTTVSTTVSTTVHTTYEDGASRSDHGRASHER